MKKTIMALGVLLAMSAGIFAQTQTDSTVAHKKTTTHKNAKARYTCTMHPEVVTSKPGKCPKCGMNLTAMKAKKTASAQKTETKMQVGFFVFL